MYYQLLETREGKIKIWKKIWGDYGVKFPQKLSFDYEAQLSPKNHCICSNACYIFLNRNITCQNYSFSVQAA